MNSRLATLLLCIVSAPAMAGIELGDWVRVDGFGTIGMYQADDPVAGYRVESTQRAYSRNALRFDGDTQLSLQAILNPHGPVKGVVQLLSKKACEGNYKPRVEWAYLSWDVNKELNLKVGRTVAPVFLLSDYRNLNYAQTMARPSSEAYAINPITHQDGVSAVWQRKLGPGEGQLEGFYGKTSLHYSNGTVNFPRVAGIAAKWTQGGWAYRIGQTNGTLSIEAPMMTAAIDALASVPESACLNCSIVLPERTRLARSAAKIWTFGVMHDADNVIVHAEWMRHMGDSLAIGNIDGMWAMSGYRIGTLTPYVSYARYTISTAELGLLAGPDASPALREQINYFNQSYLGIGRNDRSTISLGMRWDLREKMALKAQVDHVMVAYPLTGANTTLVIPTSLLGKPSGFDGRLNVFTLNLDFAF